MRITSHWNEALIIQSIQLCTRHLPIRPVQEAIEREEAEVDKRTPDWIDKHVASFPKEIKPTTFRNGMQG